MTKTLKDRSIEYGLSIYHKRLGELLDSHQMSLGDLTEDLVACPEGSLLYCKCLSVMQTVNLLKSQLPEDLNHAHLDIYFYEAFIEWYRG